MVCWLTWINSRAHPLIELHAFLRIFHRLLQKPVYLTTTIHSYLIFRLKSLQVYVGSRASSLCFDEFKVLGKDLICQAVYIDRLPHRFANSANCALHLLILSDQVLLQVSHLSLFALNRRKFVIWRSAGNFVKYLQDLLVLFLHVD